MATRTPGPTTRTSAAPGPKRATPVKAAATSKARSPARAASQAAVQPAAKAAVKPSGKASAQPVATKGKAEKAEKTDKARKPKMVRDSFTMPKQEYAVIDLLKERAAKAGRPAKKSELLRAGIKLLEGLPPGTLLATLQALPAIKTGRPAKD